MQVSLLHQPDEATIVHWIFKCCLNDDSLSKIAAGLEQKGTFSPIGKSNQNRETYPVRKYTGRALLQKVASTGTTPNKMMVPLIRISTPASKRSLCMTRWFERGSRKNTFVLKIQRTWLLLSSHSDKMWKKCAGYTTNAENHWGDNNSLKIPYSGAYVRSTRVLVFLMAATEHNFG